MTKGILKERRRNMVDQNSASTQKLTPEELLERYSIKKAAYYERLKFLDIKAYKDVEGFAYLDSEQVALLDKLDKHIRETGKMNGFTGGGNLTVSGSSTISSTPEQPRPDAETARRFDRAAQTQAANILLQAKTKLTFDYVANPQKLDPELREAVFLEQAPTSLDSEAIAQSLATAIKGQLSSQ